MDCLSCGSRKMKVDSTYITRDNMVFRTYHCRECANILQTIELNIVEFYRDFVRRGVDNGKK